ncbi:MAG: thiamine-phosphate pyrophosphorylase [Candidatus Omnitrophota bacterium]
MPKHSKDTGIERIIDANINRAKEGLRVCEEVARFILNSHSLTAEFKKLRHRIDYLIRQEGFFKNFIKYRDSLNDTGRLIYAQELKRKGCGDIFFANIQRVKESIRVLEEFSKLKDSSLAISFKRIRYAIYELEKKTASRLLNDATGIRQKQ